MRLCLVPERAIATTSVTGTHGLRRLGGHDRRADTFINRRDCLVAVNAFTAVVDPDRLLFLADLEVFDVLFLSARTGCKIY